jgi:predicted Zn-ribbon and HTH transcriptional regulator
MATEDIKKLRAENKAYEITENSLLKYVEKLEKSNDDLRKKVKTLNIHIVSNSVCPDCGYTKVKKSFEDFERCEGCEWTSK